MCDVRSLAVQSSSSYRKTGQISAANIHPGGTKEDHRQLRPAPGRSCCQVMKSLSVFRAFLISKSQIVGL